MEALFQNSTVFIFFFAMVAVFNYTDLKIEQRFCLIYISVYGLVATGVIGVRGAFVYLFLTAFCYLEILTADAMKLKLLTNPFYKLIDMLYLSFAQYNMMYILLAVCCFYFRWDNWLGAYAILVKVASVVPLAMGVIMTLRQKFVVNTFQKMYYVFSEFPINTVDFNDKLDQACNILISLEDRSYYTRKGYTILSPSFIRSVIKHKLRPLKLKQKIKVCKTFAENVFSLSRGYSTLPMQLIRTLGIKYGYSCVIRRKIYEFLYSKMFFDGVRKLMDDSQVAKRWHFDTYLLYIYFHRAKTFLYDASFSKFLNAFDMTGSEKNRIDIYDCTNEGIFIACMGLNNRAHKITEETIDYYLDPIPVALDREVILDMAANMMDRPFAGNYLK